MKIKVWWHGRNPVDFTDPLHAAAFLRILYNAMEQRRAEPVADFWFELAGTRYLGEYCVLETETEPPEKYVSVLLAHANDAITRPFIAEDGSIGTEFELGDCEEIVLDSDAISWRM